MSEAGSESSRLLGDDSPKVSYKGISRADSLASLGRQSHVSTDSNNLQICELGEDSRFDSLSSASLTWRDINVYTEGHIKTGPLSYLGCGDRKYYCKDILKRVSGCVEPGQFVAILGASGSGKTTLLNTLAQRKQPKMHVTGTIQVNGWPIEPSQMSLISAYVEQDDNFFEVMTVKETLMFNASLRMDKRIGAKSKMVKVNAIINKLGLKRCENVMVGNPVFGIKGISGGERKRLSVAVEMLMDPPLLFLDEPTSGLDSYMAESMIRLIRKLAEANRTVLTTIHQPSSEVFALFDKVCLMADGNIAFLGDTETAMKHFESFGSPCPARFNPADHFIYELALKVGSEDECLKKIEAMTTYYKESDEMLQIETKILNIAKVNTIKPNIISRKSLQVSSLEQFRQTLWRECIVARRDSALTKNRLIETTIWGLLAGFAFFMTENNQEVAQNKSGLLFFLCTSFTFSFCFAMAATIPKAFHVVKKEYRVGMYGVTPYFLSVIALMIPNFLCLVMLQLLLGYFLTGLTVTPSAFFTCYGICASMAWVASCLGIFNGTVSDSIGTAMSIGAPIIVPFVLLGGLYQNDNATPPWFVPIKYLSWIRYGWSALMVNEFSNVDHIECDTSLSSSGNITPCIFENGDQILSVYGIQQDIWWPNVAANFLLGLGLCLASLIILFIKVRR